MIGGCEQERELKLNAEQASPGLESVGTGCSEGMDDFQKYFGQSGYHRILSPAVDRLAVGLSTGIVDGMGDEPMKPSDQMEFDAELSSIFFGTEEEQPHHRNQSSVEESHYGGLLKNQKVEASLEEDSTTSLTRPSTEWTNSNTSLHTGWNWPYDLHPMADNEESEEEREAQQRWRGRALEELGRNNPMTDGTMAGDGYNHELEERRKHHPSGSMDRVDLKIPPQKPNPDHYHINTNTNNTSTNNTRNTNTNTHNTQHDLLMMGDPIASCSSHQFIDSALSLNPIPIHQPGHKPKHHSPAHTLEPAYPFNLYHQMSISSLPAQKWSHAFPLDLSQFCASLSNPSSQPNPIDQLLTSSVTEEDQHLIDLEFNHLVVEEQCAPSTPLSSQHPATNSHRLPKNNHLKSTPDFTQPFLSIDSLFPSIDQPTPRPPISDLHDLSDTFGQLITSSFDLYPSATRHSAPSSALPPHFSNPFLSDPPVTTQAAPASLAAHLQHQPQPLLDRPPQHPFEPSTTSLPSPSTTSHPTTSTSLSAPRNRLSNHSEVVRPLESRNSSDRAKDNPLLNRSQSHGALNKSNTATAEVPTEVELAIPRLDRLKLSEPYPEDLQLFLVGLQAQGAKTRVETQIKLTLVLVTGKGGSIDSDGSLSTDTPNTLTRIGNWSHIKLPVYSAIKRKSKKLIKTGIPPEETLFLEVAVVRASEPHEEIYCCSNCQVREQKRTQRKRDARVRPAQEIESDEAEQSIRPEDEKRKIVVFNCGQYVSFDSGEVTLPTRITCYCRHHREKKGFRVKVTLRDYTHCLVATSITPAIMITDDHKAVAAAAKAKSGSDAEDNPRAGRLIRRLPSANSQTIVPAPRRGRKKLPPTSIESTSDPQLASVSIENKDTYDSATGWSSSHQDGTGRIHSRSQSGSRSTSTKCKRKAPNDLNLRANIGRKTASNQTAANNHIAELSDGLSTSESTGIEGNYQRIQSLGCPGSLQDSRPHSPVSSRSLSIPMASLASHLRSTTPGSTYLWHGCPTIHRQSWQEELPMPRHTEINASLPLDVDMKDLINPLQKYDKDSFNTDRVCSQSLPPSHGSITEKSKDFASSIAPSHVAVGTDISAVSQPCDLPSLVNQGCPTSQQCQNVNRPTLSCSTTSSPDQAVVYPCSARVSTSPISGSCLPSPKSSVDFRPYAQFKCSNSTSRSSSIVCTQSRAGSDSSSRTSESSRGLPILPSQSDSPIEQLPGDPGDQPEAFCNILNDISRTCSPVNHPSITMLGNVLAEWNVASNLLPPSSQAMDARTSPESLPAGVSSRSPEAANIHPLLNTEISPGSQSNTDQPQAKLSRLIPNEGPIEGGIEITILGSNFRPGIKVDFGSGGVIQTEFWSTNTLICILPPSSHPGPCEVSIVEEGNPERQHDKGAGQIFTYVDHADRRLMELALQVVGLKMTGQLQDPKSFARKLIVETKQGEGSQDSLSCAADLVKKIDYEHQKINLMELKTLKTSDNDRKEKDDDEENLSLVRADLYSCVQENEIELNSIKLADIIWILSILVIGGAYSLSILMRIITKHKLLKPEMVVKFDPFGMDFIRNSLEL